MTVQVTLGGVLYNLPPYTLGTWERAAPFLDEINKRRAEAVADDTASVGAVMTLGRQMIGVVWAGLVKQHPELTVDDLVEATSFEEMVALNEVMDQIRVEGGLLGVAGERQRALPQPANRARRRAAASQSR